MFTEEELRGFDIQKVLGANCMVQVLHTKKEDKTYANVVSVIPLMKGMNKKTPENPLRVFSFETDEFIPDGTPEWIQKKIESAEEWQLKGKPNPGTPENSFDERNPPDDDIPF